MRKVYCDLCRNEMFIEDGQKDAVRLVGSYLPTGKNKQIAFQLDLTDNADACSSCRNRIIGAAVNEFKKIKEETQKENKLKE